MLTFFVVAVVFSILVIVHELGHMVAAKCMGVKVERFSLGFGRKLLGIKKGGTEYAVSAFPFGGYVKLAGDNFSECKGTPEEFYSKPAFKRFFILIAGSLTNYIFGFLLFVAVFMLGFPTLTASVGKILPDYPAAKSGLKKGDVIVGIDDARIRYWSDLVAVVEKKTGGKPLAVRVKRDGKTAEFRIVPKVIKGRNIFGQEVSVGKIGIMPQNKVVFVRHNFFESVALGSARLIHFTFLTYKGLWLLVTGGVSFRESVSGPIGIAVIIGQAAKAGVVSVMVTMAYINIALAIFNLLPIPVLDGGHIIFLVLEKLRGKPVSHKTQEMVSQIVLYLLIALMVFVSWNDINRFLPLFKK